MPAPPPHGLIYLDHSATTPIDPEIAARMRDADARFPGNPSSIHAAGRAARLCLEEARSALAGSLGMPAESVIFTGSGSEANNLAIAGTLLEHAGRPAHLIVSAIEHHSVLHCARALAARHDGVTLTEIACGADGRIDLDAIADAIRPATRLISLMLVNNETGVIQPVAEAAHRARDRGIRLHVDAVQALGRLPLDLPALGADLLTLAAHKARGPRGVGALLVRPGCGLAPLIHGGTQENYRRAGTENLAGAVGMAEAVRRAVAATDAHRRHLARLERIFLDTLTGQAAAGPRFELNGCATAKVPGILNLAFEGVRQDDLVVGMDLAGVAISAGSACSSGVIEPSHVLAAMNLPPWRRDGGVRISFGSTNTEQEARQAAARLAELARRLATSTAHG
ncbi:MAG TPA: cysteine desulfurase family protein [Candidatus Sumerlaeota bacterium]|nr:cysteine desulfurase family protein [Candidatus Sumerlaeota bacterium]HPK01044.1 cysteine desulfurase family protein [Candidatus Sumerlaeota bacterium]